MYIITYILIYLWLMNRQWKWKWEGRMKKNGMEMK